MNKHLIATTTLAALMAVSAVNSASAAERVKKEKCYGIVAAGQNDCANLAGTHSCAGQSTVDNDKGEWKLVAKGTCKDLGGMLKAEAKKTFKASKAKVDS